MCLISKQPFVNSSLIAQRKSKFVPLLQSKRKNHTYKVYGHETNEPTNQPNPTQPTTFSNCCIVFSVFNVIYALNIFHYCDYFCFCRHFFLLWAIIHDTSLKVVAAVTVWASECCTARQGVAWKTLVCYFCLMLWNYEIQYEVTFGKRNL